MLTIRHSNDGSVSMVWDTDADEPVRCPTQDDMDSLPVGDDLTDEDAARLEE